jgi:TAT (twin-arginine translocation) pathway signal sequence
MSYGTVRIIGRSNGRARMQRRDFLKAGLAGTALTLAQGPARAQVEPRADVKGADAKDTDADLRRCPLTIAAKSWLLG